VQTFTTDVPAGGGETISGAMTWLYNRLWRIDDTTNTKLRYGAPDYQTQYFAQRNGVITFDEDTQPLLAFLPIEPQGMVVVKDSTAATSGSYFIPNAASRDGKFEVLNIKQGFEASTATHLATHDGRVFCSNANGVFAFNGQKVEEMTGAIRNNLGSFVGATAGFLYTSPTLDAEDKAPFAAQRIAFIVDHSTSAGGDITFSVQLEEGGYGDDIVLSVPYSKDKYQRVEYDFDYDDIRTARQWRLRITGLDENIRVREIQLFSTDFEAQDYSE
jgi:hypothetical protein